MSTTGRRLRSARVVATMKRLRRFTALQLAEELDIHADNARRWVAEYSSEELLAPIGTVRKNASGVLPTLWEWRG